MCDIFTAILSCFMKHTYVKTTQFNSLDPKASLHYLLINNLYLGVNVAKLLSCQKGKISKQHLDDFLNRCQSFFVELCQQIKKILPLESDLFQCLSLLDPQIAVYNEFSSLFQITSKFVNLVDENKLQLIDNEYRELKIDKDVGNLLSSSSSCSQEQELLDVQKFWSSVSKICDNNKKFKYQNLCTFAN